MQTYQPVQASETYSIPRNRIVSRCYGRTNNSLLQLTTGMLATHHGRFYHGKAPWIRIRFLKWILALNTLKFADTCWIDNIIHCLLNNEQQFPEHSGWDKNEIIIVGLFSCMHEVILHMFLYACANLIMKTHRCCIIYHKLATTVWTKNVKEWNNNLYMKSIMQSTVSKVLKIDQKFTHVIHKAVFRLCIKN